MDFILLFVSRVRLTIFAKKQHGRHFAENWYQKRDAKLQKLTCLFCGTEGFSDCYRTAEHVLSPGCWEKIGANRSFGLKRKLLSPTRKSYNYHSERSRGGQIWSARMKSAMIKVSEDVCFWNKKQNKICLLTSYSNCFSTKPNNSVHICATRCIATTTKRQKTRRTTVRNALGTGRKTTKTKATSTKTCWNKHEPCRNGHNVTTTGCKQEPNETDATSGYKQEQLATFWCKMEPEDEEPILKFKFYVTKYLFSFI